MEYDCSYCHKEIMVDGEIMNEDDQHDCLDYMECEECPYYYEDLD